MSQPWRPKPGDRVVRHPRERQISPVRMTIPTRRAQSAALASPLILIYGFGALIAVGTLLLRLPFMHQGGGFASPIDALFTATSAATVTGLVTQGTEAYWSRLGQLVILVLMFVGGLGIMTMATFSLALAGQRATLFQRMLARDSLQVDHLGGLARLTVRIVLVAFAIQVVGLVALGFRFSFLYSPVEAIWQAAFHAVSGFNGGGFVIGPEGPSLSAFKVDRAVLGIMSALVLLGALSYWVMEDMVRSRRFSLYTLNTKLVLVTTLGLVLVGALAFFASEFHYTLRPVSLLDKVVVSVFESISGRTAGFTTVDYGQTRHQTNLFFAGLMFIGGASGSVAGGVKVNTFAVLLVSVISTLRGRTYATAYGREIPQVQVQRAVTIVLLGLASVFVVVLALTRSEGQLEFLDLLFESVSALGTVGLSAGVTPDLSRVGQTVLIISMFVGRVAPPTLGLMLIRRSSGASYRYARERVTLG